MKQKTKNQKNNKTIMKNVNNKSFYNQISLPQLLKSQFISK
jgi:hypothetical protein